MDDINPEPKDGDTLIRSGLSLTFRSAMIVFAAFMLGWFVFLACGIIYFEVFLNR